MRLKAFLMSLIVRRLPFSDSDPYSYIIKDGLQIEEGLWNSSEIEISVDGLIAGTYYYNCTVLDTKGQSVSDEVAVKVILNPESDSSELLGLFLSVGSALIGIPSALIGIPRVIGFIRFRKAIKEFENTEGTEADIKSIIEKYNISKVKFQKI